MGSGLWPSGWDARVLGPLCERLELDLLSGVGGEVLVPEVAFVEGDFVFEEEGAEFVLK